MFITSVNALSVWERANIPTKEKHLPSWLKHTQKKRKIPIISAVCRFSVQTLWRRWKEENRRMCWWGTWVLGSWTPHTLHIPWAVSCLCTTPSPSPLSLRHAVRSYPVQHNKHYIQSSCKPWKWKWHCCLTVSLWIKVDNFMIKILYAGILNIMSEVIYYFNPEYFQKRTLPLRSKLCKALLQNFSISNDLQHKSSMASSDQWFFFFYSLSCRTFLGGGVGGGRRVCAQSTSTFFWHFLAW